MARNRLPPAPEREPVALAAPVPDGPALFRDDGEGDLGRFKFVRGRLGVGAGGED
jgi:hypothetical protein